jgi:hypothetical protein
MVIIKESEMMVGTCNFPYCRGDVKYWLGDVGSPFGAGFMICEECAHQLKNSFREMFPQEPVEVPAVPAEVPVVDTVAQDELAEAIEVAVKEVKEAQAAVKEIAKKAPSKRAPAKRKAPVKKATAK